MQNAAIIFDLDGTLVDTAPDLLAGIDHVMAAVGLSALPDGIIRPHIAHGSRHMITVALEHYSKPYDDALLDDLFDRFTDYYASNIAVASRPFPGLLDALNGLRDQGARLGVCTNKRESLTLQLLDTLDLGRYFDAIVGRDTLDVSKPHPRHLTTTIERAGGSRDYAVMIGDAKPDIDAARAAGVPVVGATFGYTDVPIAQLNPDALLDDYRDLEGILGPLLNRNSGSGSA